MIGGESVRLHQHLIVHVISIYLNLSVDDVRKNNCFVWHPKTHNAPLFSREFFVTALSVVFWLSFLRLVFGADFFESFGCAVTPVCSAARDERFDCSRVA